MIVSVIGRPKVLTLPRAESREPTGCVMSRLSASGPHRSSLWRRLRPRENAATRLRGARACLALLAALAVLALAVPEQAEAQTVTTFISNSAQASGGAAHNPRATAFTTGDNTAGYGLTSVDIYTSTQSGSPNPLVKIVRNSAGDQPGTLHATLINPATVTDNNANTFNAPPNTTLTANTVYWLVVSNDAAEGGEGFRIKTGSATADTGAAMGWSIGAALWTLDIRTAWSNSNSRTIFAVKGTTVAGGTNNAPTVANPISNQTATVGTALSYEFPANTFADTDAGDTLTYTATQSDDSVLPSWLSFAALTRTFSGTPMAADVGTVSVKVTASDGTDSVSDTFDIVVGLPVDTAMTLVSNAGQGQDFQWSTGSDRSQPFTTGAAGATLSSVEIISEDAEGDDAAVSLCTVDGSDHPTSSCTVLTAPSSFAIGTLVFRAPDGTTLAANTTYSVLITSPGRDSLRLDATGSDNEDAGAAMGWSIANIFDIHSIVTDTWGFGSRTRSLRITIKGTINNAPTVATAIPDQTATTGTAFNYAFPDTTFADADGDTLTYTAMLADDTMLPSWLSFTAATRTFSGTPQATDVETVSVKVTASDGNGGSVSDTFDIVVDLPPDTSPTLVSNAGQGDDHSWANSKDRSQAFTTSAGATLSSVEIISEDPEGDDVAVSLCTVDGSNHPTSDCTVLTAPPSFAAGTLVFRAPANTPLAANTTYSLLVASPGNEFLVLDATFSEDEDAGGATGWSIADTFDVEMSSNTWVANSGRALRITIKGTITASSNNAPTVATAILDQTATAGAAFSYAFPPATFADADSDTLTYTATLADDTALPSWLSFAATTRTFSGTPTAAETVSVKVTASDGNGGSVSDTFDIVVSANTPATGEPTISGTARVGRTLTASDLGIMDVDGLPSASTFTYQWLRKAGATSTSISGANSITYTLQTADFGNKVAVRVSFIDRGGNPEMRTSGDYPTSGTVQANNTLVSNVGQTLSNVTSLATYHVAQSFTTGANAAGYTLSSIELRFRTAFGVGTSTPTVKLFSVSATGTEVATFAGPAMFDTNGTKNYAFTPTSTVTLLTSTTYWVVAEGGNGDWAYTASDSEDATPATGWSIADGSAFRAAGTTGSFTPNPGSTYMIRVNGTTGGGTPVTSATRR